MVATSISEYGSTVTYKGWCIVKEKPIYCRMYYVTDGECHYNDNDISLTLQKNHLYLFPTGKLYNVFENPQNKLNHFYVHFMPSVPITAFTEIPLDEGNFANDIFPLIQKYILIKDSERLLALTNLLVADVFKSIDTHNICFEVKKYIDANIDKKATLCTLSKKFGYSEVHLSRLFKKQYQSSLSQYLHDSRMECALSHLQSGDSISDTVEFLEFSSISNFSKAFKKKYGLSPKAYLLSQKRYLNK